MKLKSSLVVLLVTPRLAPAPFPVYLVSFPGSALQGGRCDAWFSAGVAIGLPNVTGRRPPFPSLCVWS